MKIEGAVTAMISEYPFKICLPSCEHDENSSRFEYSLRRCIKHVKTSFQVFTLIHTQDVNTTRCGRQKIPNLSNYLVVVVVGEIVPWSHSPVCTVKYLGSQLYTQHVSVYGDWTIMVPSGGLWLLLQYRLRQYVKKRVIIRSDVKFFEFITIISGTLLETSKDIQGQVKG